MRRWYSPSVCPTSVPEPGRFIFFLLFLSNTLQQYIKRTVSPDKIYPENTWLIGLWLRHAILFFFNSKFSFSFNALLKFRGNPSWRDSVTRFFVFFSSNISPGPNRHVQKGFLILSNIREVIDLRYRQPHVFITRESTWIFLRLRISLKHELQVIR
jgi:hypothetical protein